ncbi:MAG: hypothetical protein R3F61_02330 [Myxococcota bacterium]
MILWLSVALADPAALRAPEAPVVAVDAGTPTCSAAAWTGAVGGGWWVRDDGGSAGFALGMRRVPEGFGWTAHGAVGVLASLVRPGLGAHVSGAAGIARHGNRASHRLEVVIPMSLGQGQVRVPVLLEGGSAVRVGRLSIGGRGGVGLTLSKGRPSYEAQGALVVGFHREAPVPREGS